MDQKSHACENLVSLGSLAPTQILGSEAPRTTLLTEHAMGTSCPLAKRFGMSCIMQSVTCGRLEGHGGTSLSLSPSIANSWLEGTLKQKHSIVTDMNTKPVAQCSVTRDAPFESSILAPISASKYPLIKIKSLIAGAISNILKHTSPT